MKKERRPPLIRTAKTSRPYLMSALKIVLVFSLFFVCPGSAFSSRSETVIIRLKFRVATEVLPVVESMLSQDGKSTADPRTNSLVVTDDE